MLSEHYDLARGDFSFVCVKPLALDLTLQTMARRFAQNSRRARGKMQAALSPDDQYTLLHFASRCAVLAVRAPASTWCEDGLFALAMIDETRIDWRDAAVSADLLSYAIGAVAADRDRLVDGAIALAQSSMMRVIERVRTPRSLSDCMYAEIQSGDCGFGLMRRGLARYEPSIDMTTLALRIVDLLQAGRYTAEASLAEELPSVWFAQEHRVDAQTVLARARAGVAIHGKLRAGHTAERASQLFIAWVLELPSQQDAALLQRYVGAGAPLSDRYAVGVASGQLFAILVAGSAREGVEAFESPETLASLAEGTRALLEVAWATR